MLDVIVVAATLLIVFDPPIGVGAASRLVDFTGDLVASEEDLVGEEERGTGDFNGTATFGAVELAALPVEPEPAALGKADFAATDPIDLRPVAGVAVAVDACASFDGSTIGCVADRLARVLVGVAGVRVGLVPPVLSRGVGAFVVVVAGVVVVVVVGAAAAVLTRDDDREEAAGASEVRPTEVERADALPALPDGPTEDERLEAAETEPTDLRTVERLVVVGVAAAAAVAAATGASDFLFGAAGDAAGVAPLLTRLV